MTHSVNHTVPGDPVSSSPAAAGPKGSERAAPTGARFVLGRNSTRIGILGSGLMGGKLGTIFARPGHEVVFSYSRRRTKLEHLAREAGENARAGTPREAAQNADVLLVAVHWSRVEVLKQAGDVKRKVLVTCSLPMNTDDMGLVVAHTSSGAEELAEKTRGTPVVSAFGSIPSEVLHAHRQAGVRGRRRLRAGLPVRAVRAVKVKR